MSLNGESNLGTGMRCRRITGIILRVCWRGIGAYGLVLGTMDPFAKEPHNWQSVSSQMSVLFH